jgi:hypothetical protein
MSSQRLADMIKTLQAIDIPMPARPGFASALKDLMDTPGASTEDYKLNDLAKKALQDMDREAQQQRMEERLALHEHTPESERKNMADEKIEIDDKTILEAELADLAEDMTQHFAKSYDSLFFCTLVGPDTLTVAVDGRGFKKVAHMGQENFIPIEAYLGKKNRIIIKFKPKEAASYTSMEMAADDAVEKLDCFELLTVMPLGTYSDRVHEFKLKASKLREADKVKDRFDAYQNFGSF